MKARLPLLRVIPPLPCKIRLLLTPQTRENHLVPLLRKPPMRKVQQMDVTELPLEDMTPLQIFYAGREVGMKVGMKTFEANQVETDAYQDEYGSSGDTQHDETHDNDQLYALLTKSNESSQYHKASNSNQGNEKESGRKPLPGNVNRLLSKSMSRS